MKSQWLLLLIALLVASCAFALREDDDDDFHHHPDHDYDTDAIFLDDFEQVPLNKLLAALHYHHPSYRPDIHPPRQQQSPPKQQQQQHQFASVSDNKNSSATSSASIPLAAASATLVVDADPSVPDLKSKFNYAAADCAASVRAANPEARSASRVLMRSRDSYVLSPCRTASGGPRYLVIELCEEILVEFISLANLELFSSSTRVYRVSYAKVYPPPSPAHWLPMATLDAPNSRKLLTWRMPRPLRWARFLKFEMLEHYGSYHYCTLSTIKVYGTTMLEEYRQQQGKQRTEDMLSTDSAADQAAVVPVVPAKYTFFEGGAANKAAAKDRSPFTFPQFEEEIEREANVESKQKITAINTTTSGSNNFNSTAAKRDDDEDEGIYQKFQKRFRAAEANHLRLTRLMDQFVVAVQRAFSAHEEHAEDAATRLRGELESWVSVRFKDLKAIMNKLHLECASLRAAQRAAAARARAATESLDIRVIALQKLVSALLVCVVGAVVAFILFAYPTFTGSSLSPSTTTTTTMATTLRRKSKSKGKNIARLPLQGAPHAVLAATGNSNTPETKELRRSRTLLSQATPAPSTRTGAVLPPPRTIYIIQRGSRRPGSEIGRVWRLRRAKSDPGARMIKK